MKPSFFTTSNTDTDIEFKPQTDTDFENDVNIGINIDNEKGTLKKKKTKNISHLSLGDWVLDNGLKTILSSLASGQGKADDI